MRQIVVVQLKLGFASIFRLLIIDKLKEPDCANSGVNEKKYAKHDAKFGGSRLFAHA